MTVTGQFFLFLIDSLSPHLSPPTVERAPPLYLHNRSMDNDTVGEVDMDMLPEAVEREED